MWPMQMTSQVAALDVPTATFMQRERRRLKVRHIWETVNIRWLLLSDRLFIKHCYRSPVGPAIYHSGQHEAERRLLSRV